MSAGAAGSTAGHAGTSVGGAGPGGTGGAGSSGGGGAGQAGGAGEGGNGGGGAGLGGSAGVSGTSGQAGQGGTGEVGGQGGSGGGDEKIPGAKVRVATFNVRTGNADKGTMNSWENRKKLFFQVFKDLDADFIGVQEAQLFQLQDIDQAAPAYDRIGHSSEPDNKGEFVSIYYRKARFEVKDKDTFWISPTPSQQSGPSFGDGYTRIVTWGRFREKDTGYQLYMYNTHFGLSDKSAEKGAELVIARAKARATDHPFFVTGDLNTTEAEAPVRYLKGKAKLDGEDNPLPLVDTFRELYPNTDEVRTAHGFNGGVTGAKIDYVFVSLKNPDVTSAEIVHDHQGDQYPSDHYPVVGTVKMPDQKK